MTKGAGRLLRKIRKLRGPSRAHEPWALSFFYDSVIDLDDEVRTMIMGSSEFTKRLKDAGLPTDGEGAITD